MIRPLALLTISALALAAFGLPALPACAAAERQLGLRRIGQPQPFDFAALKGQGGTPA